MKVSLVFLIVIITSTCHSQDFSLLSKVAELWYREQPMEATLMLAEVRFTVSADSNPSSLFFTNEYGEIINLFISEQRQDRALLLLTSDERIRTDIFANLRICVTDEFVKNILLQDTSGGQPLFCKCKNIAVMYKPPIHNTNKFSFSFLYVDNK